MAYVECPDCGLRLNTAVAFVSDSCPRCRVRHGERIALEPAAPQARRRFDRARKLTEIELSEAGLASQPPRP